MNSWCAANKRPMIEGGGMLPGPGLESKSNIQSEAARKPQFLYDRRYWRCWLLHCSRQDKFVVILVLVPATPDINQSSKQTPKLPANSSSRKTPIPGDSPPINNQQTKVPSSSFSSSPNPPIHPSIHSTEYESPTSVRE